MDNKIYDEFAGENGAWKNCPGFEHSEEKICGFFGKYRFLSNFWECANGVDFAGEYFHTSEAAYQAAKFPIKKMHEISLLSAEESKKYSRQNLMKYSVQQWDKIKVKIMFSIVLNKFSVNEDLREKLLDTGSKYLEETNYWGDQFWGVCNGNGRNMLGQILMEVREVLK